MTLRSRLRASLASIGTKIAGATLVVLALVTAAGYVEVRQYQRETLHLAKESAATMVARLFASGLVDTLHFTDDKGAHEKASLLMANDELVHAAVYQVDPDDASSLILKLAEVQRGSAVVPPPTVHLDVRVSRDADRVVVEAPVVDGKRQLVGMVQTSFSLDREKATIAVMERRVLFGAAGLGVIVAVLLLALTQTLVVRRLARLASSVKRFEDGHLDVHLEASGRDEVGDLARAFETMTQSIAIREQRISQRNRDMQRVLDHADEGFLTVDCDGVMSDERSLILDRWFGPAGDVTSFFDYVDRVAPDVSSWLRMGWGSLRDDFMPCEVVLDQLGRRFQTNGRSLELEFRPIHEREVLVQILVVVRDVTERVERERAELAQREGMAIFRRMLADRRGFEELMLEAGRLVREITDDAGADLVHVTRAIHTLKGVTSVFEIESVAAFCHALEQRMLEDRGGPSDADRAQLAALWAAIVALHWQLNGGNHDRLEVPQEDLARLLSDLDHGVAPSRIASFVRTWELERASTRLSRLVGQLIPTARRLGKADVELVVEVSPSDLRLPVDRWAGVWTVFSHLLRNALDHGIEPLDERVAGGKAGAGRVSVAMCADEHAVTLSITDDGRGIAWDKIRASAKARGLPVATQADLEDALYADAVTSRTAVTATSGRGVGLGAVREAIASQGGSITVTSASGEGTTFHLRFPRTMLTMTPRAMSEAA